MKNWVNVVSSRIARVRYDEASRCMDVQFKRGRIYRYSPVSFTEFTELLLADSIGTALSNLVDNPNVDYLPVDTEGNPE